MKVTVTDTLK